MDVIRNRVLASKFSARASILSFFLIIFVVDVMLDGCSCQTHLDNRNENALDSRFAATQTQSSRKLLFPSVSPSATESEHTSPPTITYEPQVSSTISPTSLAVTFTPSQSVQLLTSNAKEIAFPLEPIQVISPGEVSKVVSPILVEFIFNKPFIGTYQIELHGKDGRLLVRLLRYEDLLASSQIHSVEVKFEIPKSSEDGRLSIIRKDDYGRLMDINSVDLILLSEGESIMNPSPPQSKAIIIEQPVSEFMVEDGRVRVSGITRLSPDEPLRVVLISEDGKTVGQRLASVSKEKDDGYAAFSVEVPYDVQERTPVRLMVYQDGGQISYATHLSSLTLVLLP